MSASFPSFAPAATQVTLCGTTPCVRSPLQCARTVPRGREAQGARRAMPSSTISKFHIQSDGAPYRPCNSDQVSKVADLSSGRRHRLLLQEAPRGQASHVEVVALRKSLIERRRKE